MQTPPITIKAPFPWFGGKSRAARLIWPMLGEVRTYVEPFAGSLAVLLARPHQPQREIVNDADCWLANFWRAAAADPERVAHHALSPISEVDLLARHEAIMERDGLRVCLSMDPDYYNARIAGWWLWGISAWIGHGWCVEARPTRKWPAIPSRRTPMVKLPSVSHPSGMHTERLRDLFGYMRELQQRLAEVRIVCGDWRRVLTPAVMGSKSVGILLDPPYKSFERLYSAEAPGVAGEVEAWAREHGDEAHLRIALCGYEGDYDLPGWTCEAWQATGGYANRRASNTNKLRERIWFSPACSAP